MPLQEYQLNNLKIKAQNSVRTDIVPTTTEEVKPTETTTKEEKEKSATQKKKWPLIELYRCLRMN